MHGNANPNLEIDSIKTFQDDIQSVSVDSLDTNAINNLYNVYYKYRQSDPIDQNEIL